MKTHSQVAAQSSTVTIKVVDHKKDWDSFLDFPYDLYQGHPYWVPPLRMAVKELLNVNKNPFFKHAYIRAFLAYRGSEVVGRIAGIIDHKHNDYHKEKLCFFGFFESIDDSVVAKALFDAVKGWAREWGMEKIRGPVNPSTNHECGLLVEGFEDAPAMMTTYNPPYYSALLEKNGFSKTMDLLSYSVVDTSKVKWDDRLVAHAERMKSRKNITFRQFNPRKFDREIGIIADIYNDAWESNWGFVPMDRDEFLHSAAEMKPIVDPEIFFFIEVQGKPAGFAMTLPDVNQAFKYLKRGKLFPFGFLKVLWLLKGPMRRKYITRNRLLTLGIKKEFQHLALGPIFYMEFEKRVPKKYPHTEASWILETNKPMNNALIAMGGKVVKRHRILDCSI